jgi:hypothetical protein
VHLRNLGLNIISKKLYITYRTIPSKLVILFSFFFFFYKHTLRIYNNFANSFSWNHSIAPDLNLELKYNPLYRVIHPLVFIIFWTLLSLYYNRNFFSTLQIECSTPQLLSNNKTVKYEIISALSFHKYYLCFTILHLNLFDSCSIIIEISLVIRHIQTCSPDHALLTKFPC